MNIRWITVLTTKPDQIESYLYSTSEVVATFPAKTDRFAVIVKVETDRDADFRAQYQADRLSSGLHGSIVFISLKQALTHTIDFLED